MTTRRMGAAVVALLAALLAVVPASPTGAHPLPWDPGASQSTKALPVPVAATPLVDRIDRAWPRKPPWDACARPVWPGRTSTGAPGNGRRILVIGDSLTRDSLVTTDYWLRYSGWTPTYRCWGSRRLDWGVAQVARAKQIDQLPRWVVIALGTNDISWESQATTAARLETLLDRLGPGRQVLLVNLHLTRSAWLDARADWFNGLLASWDRRRANVTVIDWHRVARAHGIRGWDGIHYGTAGFRLRALTIGKAINARARQLARAAR